MKSAQLILGNQLFHPFSHLKKSLPVVMIEHQDLCKNRKHHKIKIAFFFAAMRHYKNDLISHGFHVIYHEYDPKNQQSFVETLQSLLPQLTDVQLIEIVDHEFKLQLEDSLNGANIQYSISPSHMFLNSEEHFSEYASTVKRPFMKTYYQRTRQNNDILMLNGQPVGGKYSFDEMNRKKCPKNCDIPSREFPKHSQTTLEVIDLVNHYFSDHPGDAKNLWIPVTRSEALDWWRYFLNTYFHQFGDYEDAIDTRDDFLFHSAISPLLNIGLLTPKDIINDVLMLTDTIPINSLEGFIRQIIGWREFIRGIYSRHNSDQESLNFFSHHRTLSHHWWDGTTGHLPLDDAIKTTINRAYTHHINRLMVIGATMLTTEIEPKLAFNWFMDMYADSSDWVMGPNVYGMSLFSDGGIFATKPYLCGSNYIRKMSHYGSGDWCDIADGLYWRFISKHTEFFAKNARMGLAVKSLEKMNAEKKARIFKAADAFINKVTT